MTVKEATCFMKNLQEVLPSQTSHPSIEIACSMRRPSRRPNSIQAELEAPMRPRGTEGSNPVPSSGESTLGRGHRSSQDEKTWVERRHAGCLREDPALCNIPVVIMSSLPESNLSESAKSM